MLRCAGFREYGDPVLHTDPAGAKTQQQVDSQGRIVQVIEDPSGPNSATTNYTYDALNDLTGVTRVSQTRSFTYNSLKECQRDESRDGAPRFPAMAVP